LHRAAGLGAGKSTSLPSAVVPVPTPPQAQRRKLPPLPPVNRFATGSLPAGALPRTVSSTPRSHMVSPQPEILFA